MPLTFDRSTDRSGMFEDLTAWPHQIRRGWEAGRNAAREANELAPPRTILWAGMGGSAISGDYLAALLAPSAGFPVLVHRGGPLPAWAGEDDLVVLASYSGNTAETLATAREAIDRSCRLAALTSGGALADLAAERGIERWPVTGGHMPRAMLGEAFATALGAFHEHGWHRIGAEEMEETLSRIDELTETLSAPPDSADHPLYDITRVLADRHPMIYGSGLFPPVARRWANQFNENAKRAAQWGVLPEMNHNEVVPWTEDGSWGDLYAVLLLADPDAPDDVRRRIPVTEELAQRAGWEVHTFTPHTEHALTRMLVMTVVGDWLSYWTALAAGVDPTPIPTIDALKARLKSGQ